MGESPTSLLANLKGSCVSAISNGVMTLRSRGGLAALRNALSRDEFFAGLGEAGVSKLLSQARKLLAFSRQHVLLWVSHPFR